MTFGDVYALWFCDFDCVGLHPSQIAWDELVADGMDLQLDEFFDFLKGLDVSIPISQEYVNEMKALKELSKGKNEAAESYRKHEKWGGPSFIAKKTAFDNRKNTFKQEWLSTLGILKSIEQRLSDHKPSWLKKTYH